MEGQVSWPGGLTNHPDAFGPLCRMLLALHVALPLKSNESSAVFLECTTRCSKLLATAPLHPLLGNMLYQVGVGACFYTSIGLLLSAPSRGSGNDPLHL